MNRTSCEFLAFVKTAIFVPCGCNLLSNDVIFNDVIATACNQDNLSLQIVEAWICEGLLYILMFMSVNVSSYA